MTASRNRDCRAEPGNRCLRRRQRGSPQNVGGARFLARSSVGTLVAEHAVIDQGYPTMLSGLSMDLRYALRALGRSPSFTVAAVATLALGIGVNAGVFTVLNGVLFRDLPAPAAHEFVADRPDCRRRGAVCDERCSAPSRRREYRAYRSKCRHCRACSAFGTPMGSDARRRSPQRVYGAIVSCDYLDVLDSRRRSVERWRARIASRVPARRRARPRAVVDGVRRRTPRSWAARSS